MTENDVVEFALRVRGSCIPVTSNSDELTQMCLIVSE
jgi:hypothetical protein